MVVLDFETRSRADLRKTGAARYAADPSTELICVAWNYGQGSTANLWAPGLAPRGMGALFEEIHNGQLIWAHNAFFERMIWERVCVPKYGWPAVGPRQWRCSLACAARLTYPRSLEGVGSAMGLGTQKDLKGHAAMLRMSKPKKDGTFDGTLEKLQVVYDYCLQDVAVESQIISKLEELPPMELDIWQLDQTINSRGLPINATAVQRAIHIAEAEAEIFKRRMAELTNGEVPSPSMVARLKAWLELTGLKLPDLGAETLTRALETNLEPRQREALMIRQRSSKSSVTKLQGMLDRMDADGRVRGNLVYHGAATGRWAGTGIQIQNFPRGVLSPSEVELARELVDQNREDHLEVLLGNPLDVLSSCLRSYIEAKPGHRLMVSDFASIEARVLAWVTGEQALVDLFASGGLVYETMASRIYGVPVEEVTKTQRHVGKTAILGCGYGMGARAFKDACRTMAGISIRLRFAKQVVRAYRAANPQISSFWARINSAALSVVETGAPQDLPYLSCVMGRDVLKIVLPSGRALHYLEPRIESVQAPWSKGLQGDLFGSVGNPELEEDLEDLGIELGQKSGEASWVDCRVPKGIQMKLQGLGVTGKLRDSEPQFIQQLAFMGVQSPGRKWGPKRTYGGSLCENIVQAIARDLLAEAMLRVERAGFPIIATVHDEIVCEVPGSHGSLGEFEALMMAVPAWGSGCPIDVESYDAARYRK